MEEMTDMIGNVLTVGDLVVYPQRKSAKVWLHRAEILEISDAGLKVQIWKQDKKGNQAFVDAEKLDDQVIRVMHAATWGLCKQAGTIVGEEEGLTDMLGNALTVGDLVVYPQRQSEYIWLHLAEIIEISETGIQVQIWKQDRMGYRMGNQSFVAVERLKDRVARVMHADEFAGGM